MNTGYDLPHFQAVIFDLDGLLIDSERPFLKTLARMLTEYDAPATDSELLELAGKPVPALVEFLLSRFGSMEKVDAFRQRYATETRKMLQEGRIKRFPGAMELLELLLSRGIPTGLATSSYAPAVKLKLAMTGLAGKFTAEATGDEVAAGKPHPGIYLLAAERLNVPAESCMVLEDSVAGVTAALTAGMHTVAVASTVNAYQLSAANEVFESLEAFLNTVRSQISARKPGFAGSRARS